MGRTQQKQCLGCLIITILLTLIIVISISFSYVDYNEYAFRRQKSVNKVNTNRVYKNGRYVLGPDFDMIYFPRDYQRVDFDKLSVSDSEEKTFSMDVSFYYRVKKDKLEELYDKFGTSFHSTIKSKAQSTIKNTAPLYSIEEYLNNRTDITTVLNNNVTDELETIWIELEDSKLQLKRITLEDTTIDKYLDIAITTQENEQETYDQTATATRAETTRQVEEINTNATLLTAQATAEYDRIIAVAEAEADLVTSTARGEGIAVVIANLSLTNPSMRKTFIKLMAILDSEDVKLIDMDNSVIIS